MKLVKRFALFSVVLSLGLGSGLSFAGGCDTELETLKQQAVDLRAELAAATQRLADARDSWERNQGLNPFGSSFGSPFEEPVSVTQAKEAVSKIRLKLEILDEDIQAREKVLSQSR